MPRFARLFEAAADTLNAYYQAVADANLDALMVLWIDEDFASCIWSDGTHLHGLEQIRSGFGARLSTQPVTIEPLDIRVYDSLGTVVYTVAEAHQQCRPHGRAADGVHDLRDDPRARRMADRPHPRESDPGADGHAVRREDPPRTGAAPLSDGRSQR
ncbi:alternative dihydrofolate reductase 3 [Burkholderia pseudomallei]|nr:nuclear transport factor 2 family protein [Burkholderia pseudomallei]CFV74901.1 alternative dihydrofolate reductase 3 [Burkholderia pseudomallei]CPF29433.1 alternative dihydrofolate reductase 3 [Burkholderia pseudomallei]